MKKKIFLLIACGMLAISSAYGQNYTRNGKEFSSVKAEKVSTSGEKTGYTWKDSSGKVYDIYITKSNACYIIRTSKKTGKEYRSYLPKEVAYEIAKELKR